MKRSHYLFRGNDMSAVLEAQRKGLRDCVETLTADYISSVPDDELVESLADQFRIDVPILDLNGRNIDPREEKRHERGEFGSYEYTVNVYTVHIPFTGEAGVFNFRPNTWDLNPPNAEVHGSEITLAFEQRRQNATELENEIQRLTNSIEKHLGWLREMVEPFNAKLPEQARNYLKQRKEKLGRDAEVLTSLGIPLRQRTNVPTTAAVPVKRKSIPLPKRNSAVPAKPDPTLPEAAYQQIIKTMADMALTIERNPTAFEHLNEEQIRFQFLVPLNSLYEGNATAETFSYQGKTDIQIRYEGKPIFTAECKFWTGPKGFTETLDQLLGYVTWRDTKAAILLFNKNKNLSQVLEQVEPTLRSHPRFVRFEGKSNETEFKFVIAQPNDPNRHVALTVLVFDIPER